MFNKCLTRALKFACELARVPFVWQNNKSYTTPTLITGSRGDVFVVRTSKPVENLGKNGLFWSRYSFVTHSIDRKPRGSQDRLAVKDKEREETNLGPIFESLKLNGIEWNGLILLTWSGILMYLPNTVGKRHKKVFKFINRVLFPDSTRTTYTRDLHAQEKNSTLKCGVFGPFGVFGCRFVLN